MPGHSSLPCADCVNLSAMPGIHVFTAWQERRGWPGHRRAEATPSFGRLCPAMTKEQIVFQVSSRFPCKLPIQFSKSQGQFVVEPSLRAQRSNPSRRHRKKDGLLRSARNDVKSQFQPHVRGLAARCARAVDKSLAQRGRGERRVPVAPAASCALCIGKNAHE